MNKVLLCALALTWTVMGACTTVSNEGWTPVSATIKMIDAGSDQAKAAYEKLSDAEKAKVTNRNKIGY